jgi:hypothetical protein
MNWWWQLMISVGVGAVIALTGLVIGRRGK